MSYDPSFGSYPRIHQSHFHQSNLPKNCAFGWIGGIAKNGPRSLGDCVPSSLEVPMKHISPCFSRASPWNVDVWKGFALCAVKGSILVQTSNEETWIPWKKEKQSWTGRSSWQDKKRTQHKKILGSWHVAIRSLIECHCRPCDFFVISRHVFLTARSCPSVKINWWSNSKPYSPNPTEWSLRAMTSSNSFGLLVGLGVLRESRKA